MGTQTVVEARLVGGPARVSWSWVHVAVAALAMVATLPGRTHGLGLFTEPILRSLSLDRESYGFVNLWATLLGGLFCLPAGWLLDRFGTRAVLTGVTGLLGFTVVAMSGVRGYWPVAWTLPLPGSGSFSVVFPLDLLLFLLLTRGLGQSALSVASLALIGRSAGRRPGLAMGVYAGLTSLGFTGAFAILRDVAMRHPDDWRVIWAGIGMTVVAAGVLCGVLVRNEVLTGDGGRGEAIPGGSPGSETSQTLQQALACPAFWTFAVSTSFFGMVSAGISLFNQSILEERHFDRAMFLTITVVGIPFGLAGNLLGGWLASRWSLHRLLAVAMALQGGTLLVFPRVEGETQLYAYAIAYALAGGMITVCFFAVWRRGFGPAHLGRIQGAAQLLTVIASALGPQLFASIKSRLHWYRPVFPWLAACSFGLALAAWLTPLPSAGREPKTIGRTL